MTGHYFGVLWLQVRVAPNCRASTIASISLLISAALCLSSTASGQGDVADRVSVRQSRSSSKSNERQYAIEFRARHALSYGHTFIMYGRLDEKGQLVNRVVAGLHPAGDDPQPWMLGHIVPVRSETGPSDGDLEDQYVSASYRVIVSPREYTRIVEYIKNKQASSPTWHALFNNCSAWVGDVGSYMGLRVPPAMFSYPQDYINRLRDLNVGNDRSAALSLKD